MVIITCT